MATTTICNSSERQYKICSFWLKIKADDGLVCDRKEHDIGADSWVKLVYIIWNSGWQQYNCKYLIVLEVVQLLSLLDYILECVVIALKMKFEA